MALGDLIRNAWLALSSSNLALQIEYAPAVQGVMGLSPDEMWRTQPHLRTIVDFLARNTAHLGLQTFQRVTDNDRRRLRDDPVALLLARPNPHMTTYELVYSLVADKALYNEAFWMLVRDPSAASGWLLQPIPPSWVMRRGGENAFWLDWVDFRNPVSAQIVRVQMDQLLWFKGWNPGFPRHASSPIEALRDILAEQIDARTFRRQMWRRGGRFGGFLTRPAGTRWDKETREKFKRDWRNQYTSNDGGDAGGTPILEDGMTYSSNRFSSREEDWIEGTKLSLAQVASVYQVNPTMVGLLDNANFSNVEAFRKMLYTDTLGPMLAEIEDRINGFLIPVVTTTPGVYVEFNIAEKLQGSFQEQAAALQSAVGRPWMTADEARSLNNMPALGGDAERLVTPLNVLIGGQASPQDSGSQNLNDAGTMLVKAAQTKHRLKTEPPQNAVEKASEVLTAFFDRQKAVVMSKLGAKAGGDWWDADRWDKELADDLYPLSVQVATELGEQQAKALGFDADAYDQDRTLAFLKAVAEKRAEWINAATKTQIDAALATPDGDVGQVFDTASGQRSGAAAGALVAALTGFATVEAGKQLVGDRATKTWETGPNPRPEHAAMDGETVGIQDSFSNGADWPGDPVLGAEGVANCNCGVSVTF